MKTKVAAGLSLTPAVPRPASSTPRALLLGESKRVGRVAWTRSTATTPTVPFLLRRE